MKRGDKVPVTIAGQTVANAEVREVGDGQVTLVVPGTLVVMATRTEIAYEAPSEPVRETETVITGVDRSSAEQPVESAAVGETNDPTPSTTTEATTPSTTETVAAEEVSAPSTDGTDPVPAEPSDSPAEGASTDTGNEA